MANLSLSIVEIVVLMLGAIILGITIHFFLSSRRGMKNSPLETEKVNKSLEEWKLRYFNDVEMRDKELGEIKQQLQEAEENSTIYTIEAEEMRNENKKLRLEMETLRKTIPSEDKPDYLEQLRFAQTSLMAHNEKISQLLGQIDIVKEKEMKQQEIMKENERLSEQIAELKLMLANRDKEIHSIRQKEYMTKEVRSMLDSALEEFNALQSKIQKLEAHAASSKMINMDYEDLKEAHYKLNRDFEEHKLKYVAAATENQELQIHIHEMEDKLKDVNFQRQQLQKRVTYLEELTEDLHTVSDANKKLEGQLKRIGELESKLNIASEERDHLASSR